MADDVNLGRRTAALTSNQTAVLLVLRRHEVPPTIREVANWLRLSRSSVQTAVMGLIRRGLAEQAGSAMSGGTTFRATESEAGRPWLTT